MWLKLEVSRIATTVTSRARADRVAACSDVIGQIRVLPAVKSHPPETTCGDYKSSASVNIQRASRGAFHGKGRLGGPSAKECPRLLIDSLASLSKDEARAEASQHRKGADA